jgi:hypothetical protein
MAIGDLQVAVEDKENALANRITWINTDLSLLKAGNKY